MSIKSQKRCQILNISFISNHKCLFLQSNVSTTLMANPFFRFKKFTIWHDKCAMKVGTDGVLLGAWANINKASRILDVGTGTGLVALMLAQRTKSNTVITALEIDKAAVEQAKENINKSPWFNSIHIIEIDYKEFSSNDKFDIIVSNPPYFIDSLKCPNNERSKARHNHDLTYEELIRKSSELLSEEGLFTVILPIETSDIFKNMAETYNLHLIKQLFVRTKPNIEPKRTLMTFSFHQQPLVKEYLLIEIERHQYSDEYVNLTKDFYLNM